MSKNEWCLINVVWYDGVEAYVSPMIGQATAIRQASKETKDRITKYLDGNGEILKYDVIRYLSIPDIVEYKHKGDSDSTLIYNRFLEIWGH